MTRAIKHVLMISMNYQCTPVVFFQCDQEIGLSACLIKTILLLPNQGVAKKTRPAEPIVPTGLIHLHQQIHSLTPVWIVWLSLFGRLDLIKL